MIRQAFSLKKQSSLPFVSLSSATISWCFGLGSHNLYDTICLAKNNEFVLAFTSDVK